MSDGVVVVLSGGLDSTVLLAETIYEEHDVYALTVDYGQRHRKEVGHAHQVATHFGVPLQVADLSTLRGILAGSSQTDDRVPVPHGHYAAASMKATVVPNRNMILLSVGVGYAISVGASAVTFAAHAGDHTIYPDCRPEFVAALDKATHLCHWSPVALVAPFVGMSKPEIVMLGHERGVPFDLTWSCYEGGEVHCGRCGTCVERREAFVLAGVPDPTTYRES